MEKRTTAIVVTAITVLCCGCPGLFSVFWGLISASVSFMPGAQINMNGSSDPRAALLSGVAACCGGILFILIPVVVGFVMLRNKPAQAVMPVSDEVEEPVTPSSAAVSPSDPTVKM
jgi:hypothetical protein